MSDIRVVNFFRLEATDVATVYYQNYFINETKTYLSTEYYFVPFRVEGAMATLNGDNEILQVLFPNLWTETETAKVGLALLEQFDGNRLTELELTTAWLDGNGEILRAHPEYYIGIGSSVSDTTIELRFRSAIDSVGSAFPARTLTRNLVGPLPLNSELYLT